ncbi:hypothetical protein GU926_08365 [Nibribacter ruber]|uniref:Uncharacterized protein n=1 Tax=Nibribacter ruber TaxID=2698458 RepID=A0A6P1NWN1_9BACT|nr:hypothetical protein [Nibribacter ruber]QHL87450.1 hypothetical protein GU926_08365 [Nibribacter ruber]
MEKDVAELIIQHVENLKSLSVGLIALLVVNILGLLGRFWVEGVLKNRDIKINKAAIINNRKVTVQESLYHLFDSLSLINPYDAQELSIKIVETDMFIRKNSLFLDTRIHNISIALLDYFKEVQVQPRKKDIKYEFDHLDMYTDEFTKF